MRFPVQEFQSDTLCRETCVLSVTLPLSSCVPSCVPLCGSFKLNDTVAYRRDEEGVAKIIN